MKKLYVLLAFAAVWLSLGLQGAQVSEGENDWSPVLQMELKNKSSEKVYYAYVTVDKHNKIVNNAVDIYKRVGSLEPNSTDMGESVFLKGRNIEIYKEHAWQDLFIVSYTNAFDALSSGKTIAESVEAPYKTAKIPGINCRGWVEFIISDATSKKGNALQIKTNSANVTCQNFFNPRRSVSKARRSISATTKKWKPSLSTWVRKKPVKSAEEEATANIELQSFGSEGGVPYAPALTAEPSKE